MTSSKPLLTPEEEKLLAEMNPATAARVRPLMELSRQTLNDLQERIDDLKVHHDQTDKPRYAGCGCECHDDGMGHMMCCVKAERRDQERAFVDKVLPVLEENMPRLRKGDPDALIHIAMDLYRAVNQ